MKPNRNKWKGNRTKNGNRWKKGSEHPYASLTEAKVKRILELLAEGLPQKVIAKRFNCCKQNITAINRGKSWLHVERPVKA